MVKDFVTTAHKPENSKQEVPNSMTSFMDDSKDLSAESKM